MGEFDLGLSRTAAADVAKHDIRVNCICPGPIDTQLMVRSELLVNPDDRRGAPRAAAHRQRAR